MPCSDPWPLNNLSTYRRFDNYLLHIKQTFERIFCGEWKQKKNFMKKENNFHLDWIVNFNTAEFQQMLRKKSTSIYTPFTVLVLKNQHLIETPVFLIVKLICCDWISWPFKPFIHCKDSYIYFIHLS